jgi:hypothetical protein
MRRESKDRRWWRLATSLAAAVATTVAATLATVMFVPAAQAQPPGPSGCLATDYSATSWNNTPTSGGFIANITITNTCEEAAQGWTIQLTLPPQHEFVSGWSATWTINGSVLTGADSGWNAELRPGRSVLIGFMGTFTGTYQDPFTCTINGADCQGYDSGPAQNQPPEVEITGNVALTYRCPMTLSASASDPDGEVERVEFYVNGELVGTAHSAPYQVRVFPDAPVWNWDGQDQLSARAYDDGDPQLSTDSDPVTVPLLPVVPQSSFVAPSEWRSISMQTSAPASVFSSWSRMFT